MEHAHTQPDTKMNDMHNMESSHYNKFLLMIGISFVVMFILMYSMINSFPNFILNINQVYMAGLMTAAMVIIELLVMGGMYKNKKLNMLILALGAVLGILFFCGIRKQAFVADKEFLKSMIPHHAGAILMVEQAKLTDPEVKQLAQGIITSQQKEIDFMKAKIKAMESK